jgi:hypothetical protein
LATSLKPHDGAVRLGHDKRGVVFRLAELVISLDLGRNEVIRDLALGPV